MPSQKGFLKRVFNLLDPQENRILESIKRITLFQDLSESDLQSMAKKCHIRHFNIEEEIYPEESPAAALYFIISGSVGIFKKRRSNMTDRIQVLHTGQFFGDSSLVNSNPRKNSTKALEKTQVLVLFRTDFEMMERTRPKLAGSSCSKTAGRGFRGGASPAMGFSWRLR